jgi:hypothetical protein
MTLTKSSTNYDVQDMIGEVKVNGNVSIKEDGGININFNTDNGGYLNYSKNADGFVNFNSSFLEANDIIDYAQTLIAAIMQELGGNQE